MNPVRTVAGPTRITRAIWQRRELRQFCRPVLRPSWI